MSEAVSGSPAEQGQEETRSKPRKRPRRDCEVCGRTQVAIQTNGRLYRHKWPGLGMWADGPGDCDGIDHGR